MSRFLHLFAGVVVLGSAALSALAQPARNMTSEAAARDYPNRPIRFILPFPPGGGADTIARVVGQKLTDAWHEQVVIDNRPGAGGNLAAILAAKAAPDGYTLLQSTVGHAIGASLDSKLPYDLARDFAAVTQLASTPFLLVVRPSFSAASVAELVALAKSKPNDLTFASSGIGGPSHLAMELFKSATRIEMRHIPYKGAAQSLTDMLGGQVDMTFTSIAAVLPLVKAGKVRALGVGSLRRIAIAPAIPTIDEAGVKGFEAGTWYGVQVPAGTPRSVVAALNSGLVRILHQPDIVARLATDAFDVVGNKPEEFAAYIRSEISKWASAVKNSGMRIE